MNIQTLVDINGVEIVVFSDRTSAWHKFATDSVIIRRALAGDVPDVPREKRRHTRPFVLRRNVDVSGVSGVGIIAEGVAFSDGMSVLRWLTATASTAVYDSPEDVVTIHGHGGATSLVWLKERDGQWVVPE